MQTDESTLTKPKDLDSLRDLIVKRYDTLSQRLQQTADYVLSQPMTVAMETMSTIAENADVPLSTLSRFSNTMGFSGFSQMQGLFRDQYLNRPRDYKERVKQAKEKEKNPTSPQALFHDFGQANIEALEQLQISVSPDKLERAVELLSQADTIYVQGIRRAYPVAFYFWYALMKSDANVVLLDDMGGMLGPLTRRLTDKDVLVAVTFSPYAPETSELIRQSYDRRTRIIGITDNQKESQGSKMEVCFEVQEGEIMGFRSLSSSIYLAQTLAVSYMCRERGE